MKSITRRVVMIPIVLFSCIFMFTSATPVLLVDGKTNESSNISAATTKHDTLWFVNKTLPDRVEVLEGCTLVLDCRADGNPPPTKTTWMLNNRPLARYYNNKAVLTVRAPVPREFGNYTCVVENQLQNISHTFTVIRTERLHLEQIELPKNKTVKIGGSETLVCKFESTGEKKPKIEWWKTFKNHHAADEFQSLPDEEKIWIANGETLKLSNLTKDEEGWYTCTVNYIDVEAVASAFLRVSMDLDELLISPMVPDQHTISPTDLADNNFSQIQSDGIEIFE